MEKRSKRLFKFDVFGLWEKNIFVFICNIPLLEVVLHKFFFEYFFFNFFNYESMITYLQETWNIQTKVTYSFTICYHSFFK